MRMEAEQFTMKNRGKTCHAIILAVSTRVVRAGANSACACSLHNNLTPAVCDLHRRHSCSWVIGKSWLGEAACK